MSRPKFLEEATAEELEKRLEELKNVAPPKMLDNPELDRLKTECQIYIDTLAKGNKPDRDSKQYIYESAMTAFFGKDIFKWINRKP
jgi:hypothetical protein